LESIEVVELARREEVEEVEQLLQVVLQRRTGQQQLEIDAVAGQGLEELGLGVLQSVGLVDAQDLPVNRAKTRGINGDLTAKLLNLFSFVTDEEPMEEDQQ